MSQVSLLRRNNIEACIYGSITKLTRLNIYNMSRMRGQFRPRKWIKPKSLENVCDISWTKQYMITSLTQRDTLYWRTCRLKPNDTQRKIKQDWVCWITQYAKYNDTLTEKNVTGKLREDSLIRESFFFPFSFFLHRRFAAHILLKQQI